LIFILKKIEDIAFNIHFRQARVFLLGNKPPIVPVDHFFPEAGQPKPPLAVFEHIDNFEVWQSIPDGISVKPDSIKPGQALICAKPKHASAILQDGINYPARQAITDPIMQKNRVLGLYRRNHQQVKDEKNKKRAQGRAALGLKVTVFVGIFW
jgi:hypothetical protein